jgi:hypothetical protein
MSYYHLTKLETDVWKFLNEENMNCNPDEWEKGYKKFLKHSSLKKAECPFELFEEVLLDFRNYYKYIAYDYDSKSSKFGQFLINSHSKVKLYEEE